VANTHAIPDSFYEMQSVFGDLGPQVIVAHSGLSVPVSSLTLPAVAASGYVKVVGPPLRMAYVSQPAASLTFPGNGTYWLALHTDLSTAASGWTRRAGTHYVWQQNATQPPGQTQLLGFAQITVAGGVITAVTLLPNAVSPPLSQQNSNAVAITGGTATGLTAIGAPSGTHTILGNVGLGIVAEAGLSLKTGTHAYLTPNVGIGTAAGQPFDVGVPTRFQSPVGIGIVPPGATFSLDVNGHVLIRQNLGVAVSAGGPYALTVGGPARMTRQYLLETAESWSAVDNHILSIGFNKGTVNGIGLHQKADAGGGNPLTFYNLAGTVIGTIATSGSATAYNTSSDVRLKTAITPLTAALERIRALRPVQFLWKSDDSPGVGFIAHEVQEVLDGVITGEADAVDEAGEIVPQQIDHSKLVPWLTAALKETLAQVEALTARVAALEAAQA
jgi:hypothetical protein